MQKNKYTFYKYRYMICRYYLKTFYKNIDLLSKNWVKRYVLSPFFQLSKDGDM